MPVRGLCLEHVCEVAEVNRILLHKLEGSSAMNVKEDLIQKQWKFSLSLSLSRGILMGCTDMTRFFALCSSAWSCQRRKKLSSEMDLFPTKKRPKPIQSETD
jgi:hypothetical protein